jgi:hypothetical protein
LVIGAGTPESDGQRTEVIRLDLDRAIDMFETPAVDLGSEHGSFVPGIDLCAAEVQAHNMRQLVRVEITLPESEITPGLEGRLATTLRRYCDERAHTDDLKRRSFQRTGLRALRIGLPVTLIGLAITAVAYHTGDSDDPQTAVVDILGWVLAWVGLWYPFDKLLFYPSDFVREMRAFQVLRDAKITVVAREAGVTVASDGSDGAGTLSVDG